jgi:hypothetical protein
MINTLDSSHSSSCNILGNMMSPQSREFELDIGGLGEIQGQFLRVGTETMNDRYVSKSGNIHESSKMGDAYDLCQLCRVLGPKSRQILLPWNNFDSCRYVVTVWSADPRRTKGRAT